MQPDIVERALRAYRRNPGHGIYQEPNKDLTRVVLGRHYTAVVLANCRGPLVAFSVALNGSGSPMQAARLRSGFLSSRRRARGSGRRTPG
jgi:hypothetical protein